MTSPTPKEPDVVSFGREIVQMLGGKVPKSIVEWLAAYDAMKAERDAAVRERDALILRGKAGDDYLAHTAAERDAAVQLLDRTKRLADEATVRELQTLRAKLAEAEKDAARLDWLEAMRTFEVSAMLRGDLSLAHWLLTVYGEDDDFIGKGKTFREAIDTARTAATAHPHTTEDHTV